MTNYLDLFRGVIKVLYFANNWLRTTGLSCSFILATAYKDTISSMREITLNSSPILLPIAG